MRHRSTSSRSWERCRCRPGRPSAPTANETRVRQPRPSGAPGTSSTTHLALDPRRARRSCSATRAALSSRWRGRATCCQSQPPHRPGRAYGHGGSTRSGEASSTSTASARRYLVTACVTRARTRSPGTAWRTNTTRPSGARATHAPPAAAAPTSSSSSSPTWAPSTSAPSRSPREGRRCAGAASATVRSVSSSRRRSDDRSWYGTLVTITPGWNSSRVFRRSALWLCSSCSHQWPDDVLGDVDRHDVARALERGSRARSSRIGRVTSR